MLIRRLVPDNDAGADGGEGPARRPAGALLLGLAVLAVLYPLVSLEGGASLPLVLLPAFPLLAWAFVRWEARTVGRGHPPLLDVSLLRGLPGYANGLLVGTLYFTGFTGIFLVLSVAPPGGRGLLAAGGRAAHDAVRRRRGDHLAAGGQARRSHRSPGHAGRARR